jgi:hypothetical protein
MVAGKMQSRFGLRRKQIALHSSLQLPDFSLQCKLDCNTDKTAMQTKVVDDH